MVFQPRPSPRFLLTLAALVILAAVGWIVFGPSPPRTRTVMDPSGWVREVPVEPLKPVAMDQALDPPLPGAGPLVVELRYLGAESGPLLPPRGGELDGKILNDRREPRPGARIRVVGGPQDGLETRAGEDGSFRLLGLLPGTHLLRIEDGGLVAGRMQRILGRAPTRRNFLIGDPIPLTFEVHDDHDEVLPGARLRVDLGAAEAVTGEDGRASFPGIARGPRVLVEVRAEGFVPLRYELNLLPRHSTGDPVVLGPLPKGGVIRGQVKSWPGMPMPTVTVVPRSSHLAAYQVAWETWQGVPVQSDGRFVLRDLPTTRLVDIRVSHPNGVSKPLMRTVRANAQSPSTVSFVILRGKDRITGRVTDPSGTPIDDARVVLEAADPAAVLGAMYPGLADSPVAAVLPSPAALRREVRTGADGRFDFAFGDHPRGSGRLLLSAAKEGYASARSEVRNARSSFRLVLHPVRKDSVLEIEGPRGHELPPVQWYLDGKALAGARAGRLEGLARGYYEVLVRRGARELISEEALEVRGSRTLSLR